MPGWLDLMCIGLDPCGAIVLTIREKTAPTRVCLPVYRSCVGAVIAGRWFAASCVSVTREYLELFSILWTLESRAAKQKPLQATGSIAR